MSAKGHHILSSATSLKVWIVLLFLTVITVVASRIDLGMFNFSLAMLIATVKAFVVVMFFMGLKYDSSENRVIFFSSFIFVFIFVFLTYSDLLFRQPPKSSLIPAPVTPAAVVTPSTHTQH